MSPRAEERGARHGPVSSKRLDCTAGDRAGAAPALSPRRSCLAWLRPSELQGLASGSNQFSHVNVGHAAAAEVVEGSKGAAGPGLRGREICTPRGQMLVPEDFERLER